MSRIRRGPDVPDTPAAGEWRSIRTRPRKEPTMYLGIRDIRAAKGRFALIGSVVG
ncbi:Uncharacterised protein [Rothia kristinae]|nr:Uncharacterised protein [Rothia kristinae]